MRFSTRVLTLSAITLALATLGCNVNAQDAGSAFTGGLSQGVVIANGRNIQASTTVKNERDVVVGNASQHITCNVLFTATAERGIVTKYSTAQTSLNGGGVMYNNGVAGTGSSNSYLQITGSGITVTQQSDCNTCTLYKDGTQSCAASRSINVADVASGYVLGNAISSAGGATSGGAAKTSAGSDAAASGGLSAAGSGIGLTSTQTAGSLSNNANGGVLAGSDSYAQQNANVAYGGASTLGAASAGSAVQGTNTGTSGSAGGVAVASGLGAQTSVAVGNSQGSQVYNQVNTVNSGGYSTQTASLGTASSIAATSGSALPVSRFSTSYSTLKL